jgi:hypothetical protein
VYAPCKNEPSGQALLFTEGWLLNRLMTTIALMVLASLVISVVWSALGGVQNGFAAGGYVLAASSGVVGVISLISALDNVG